jgi:hypothetical protein
MSNWRTSKIYKKWDFWFEKKPSGNPAWGRNIFCVFLDGGMEIYWNTSYQSSKIFLSSVGCLSKLWPQQTESEMKMRTKSEEVFSKILFIYFYVKVFKSLFTRWALGCHLRPTIQATSFRIARQKPSKARSFLAAKIFLLSLKRSSFWSFRSAV